MLLKAVTRGMLFILCLWTYSTVFAQHPSKAALPPAELKHYYDSGKYLQEINLKTEQALEYLEGQLRYGRKGQLAMVLEIDETALSNYAALERMQFTHNDQALAGTYLLGQATAIPPILALYEYALKNKIAVFFVSSRPNTPEIMAATIKNLKSAGFNEWQELILMPVEGPQFKVADFKTHTRSYISLQGYEILLNMSARDEDLNGGYAEIKVKLPNPFYA